MDIRVYYEDTDCGGVVYYANYLRYFERARTEYLRERGLEVIRLANSPTAAGVAISGSAEPCFLVPDARFAELGVLFMVGHAELTYHHPARYNDLLEVQTQIPQVGRASFTFAHRILRQGTDRLIVKGQTKMVCVDQQGKPRRLPEELSNILRQQKAR